jgi:hypothetical protein
MTPFKEVQETVDEINKIVSEMSPEELVAHDRKSFAKHQALKALIPDNLTPFPTLEEEMELYKNISMNTNEGIQALIAVEESNAKLQESILKAKDLLVINKDEDLGTDCSADDYDIEDQENIDSIYSTMSTIELAYHAASIAKALMK